MSFTCFPRLSLEIRRTIWEEACCVTRVLDIRGSLVGSERFAEAFMSENSDPPVSFHTCRRVPSILHVSQEARLTGLEHYELAFGTDYSEQLHGATIKLNVEAHIYVNWDHDIICPIAPSDEKPLIHDLHEVVENMLLASCTEFPRIAIDLAEVQVLHDGRGCLEHIIDSVDEIIVFWPPYRLVYAAAARVAVEPFSPELLYLTNQCMGRGTDFNPEMRRAGKSDFNAQVLLGVVTYVEDLIRDSQERGLIGSEISVKPGVFVF